MYRPGATVAGATKLASNETPYPPLPHVLAAIAESAQRLNRYPDTFSTALSQRIADRHGVRADQVAVGCGSVSLCSQLVLCTVEPGSEVLYAWRSFEANPIVVALGGAVPVPVPLRDGVHDLDAMADAITERTRLIFVCNPNNPTGTVISRADLIAFLARVPADVLVVLDEAYIEFATAPEVPDGIALLSEHDNLVVLRTFSKAYGLAGLRVGYAIAADSAVAAALRQTQLPFVVTQVAQDAALASLDPAAERELMERVADLNFERERVRAGLRECGYDVRPSQANFVWLPLGGQSTQWAEALAQRQLIVRSYPGDGVRITIGTPAENDRVLHAARQVAGT